MLLLLRGRAGVAFFDLGLGLWEWDRYWRYVCIDEYEVIQLTISLVTLMFGVRDNYIPLPFIYSRCSVYRIRPRSRRLRGSEA